MKEMCVKLFEDTTLKACFKQISAPNLDCGSGKFQGINTES